MKIEIKFEPKDFEGCGQLLIQSDFDLNKDGCAYGITVAYKVGYAVNETHNQYLLISMADGLVVEMFDDLQGLCKFLNENKNYRPMSNEEIQTIFVENGARFYSCVY